MYKFLWESIIGSHMWKMEHEGSDKDFFEAYIVPSRDMLVGKNITKGKSTQDKEKRIDIVKYEIGNIITQLLKGNVNFLWGVMSPLSYYSDVIGREVHEKIKEIVLNNLSKNYFNAVNGMVIHNLWHWFGIKVKKEKPLTADIEYIYPVSFKTDIDSEKGIKIRKQIFRNMKFLRKLLCGSIVFEPVGLRSLEFIEMLHKTMICEYLSSDMQYKPDPEPFNKFLLDLRVRELCGCL